MSVKFYQSFVDGLVELSASVTASRFLRGVWHPEPPPSQVKRNVLLSQLSEEQRGLLAEILIEERTGGIHDVLVYLQDQGLCLRNPDGESFSESPYDTGMNYDYVCRLNGDAWPCITVE